LAESALAPVPLLAALKHPLAAGGMAPETFRDRARKLEEALRGPRPAPGFAGLKIALAKSKPVLRDFVRRLEYCLGDLAELLAAGTVVRPSFGRHPRLSIWGLVEARLQQADLVVLGGLNEGTWPGPAAHDPWMSRQMRQEFGIAVPERAIGIAAHDFVQGIAA